MWCSGDVVPIVWSVLVARPSQSMCSFGCNTISESVLGWLITYGYTNISYQSIVTVAILSLTVCCVGCKTISSEYCNGWKTISESVVFVARATLWKRVGQVSTHATTQLSFQS